MSVLASFEAVPSRIAGVFRYLLTCQEHRDTYARLEVMLSPPTLHTESGRGRMIREVLKECDNMDLLEVTEETNERQVSLHQKVLGSYPGRAFVLERFRTLLADLIIDQTNPNNHDLCLLIAWLMAQNPLLLRGDYDSVNKELGIQIGDERLGLTTERPLYDDFCYWVTFLGFAWTHRSAEGAKPLLVPDPTRYLQNQLPSLLDARTGQDLPLWSFMEELASRCPVFRGGYFHAQVARKASLLPASEPGHLPGSLSCALLRLQEKRLLTLKALPDADMMLLFDGKVTEHYTHLRWHGDSKGLG